MLPDWLIPTCAATNITLKQTLISVLQCTTSHYKLKRQQTRSTILVTYSVNMFVCLYSIKAFTLAHLQTCLKFPQAVVSWSNTA